ncbi:DUF721 domain-containing protein, partial [Actinomadura kijaniata]
MTDDPQGVHNPPDEPASPAPSGPAPGAPPAKTGIELAREALAQAKADALKRGTLPGQGRKRARNPLP